MTEKLYTAETDTNRFGKKRGEVFMLDTDKMERAAVEALSIELRFDRVKFLRHVHPEEASYDGER
jgi:hypothetical protein